MSSALENAQIIELPSVFNHAEVGSVMQQVSAEIDAGKTVTFNASGVERTDGAAVQLLIACQHHRETSSSSSGAEPLIIDCSNVLRNAIIDMGAIEFIDIQAA